MSLLSLLFFMEAGQDYKSLFTQAAAQVLDRHDSRRDMEPWRNRSIAMFGKEGGRC